MHFYQDNSPPELVIVTILPAPCPCADTPLSIVPDDTLPTVVTDFTPDEWGDTIFMVGWADRLFPPTVLGGVPDALKVVDDVLLTTLWITVAFPFDIALLVYFPETPPFNVVGPLVDSPCCTKPTRTSVLAPPSPSFNFGLLWFSKWASFTTIVFLNEVSDFTLGKDPAFGLLVLWGPFTAVTGPLATLASTLLSLSSPSTSSLTFALSAATSALLGSLAFALREALRLVAGLTVLLFEDDTVVEAVVTAAEEVEEET